MHTLLAFILCCLYHRQYLVKDELDKIITHCIPIGLVMCHSRKYPYPSHGRFFKLNPPPSGNSILVSYFRSKNWAFETPLPLGISINLPWDGHGYFLELHNISIVSVGSWKLKCSGPLGNWISIVFYLPCFYINSGE